MAALAVDALVAVVVEAADLVDVAADLVTALAVDALVAVVLAVLGRRYYETYFKYS